MKDKLAKCLVIVALVLVIVVLVTSINREKSNSETDLTESTVENFDNANTFDSTVSQKSDSTTTLKSKVEQSENNKTEAVTNSTSASEKTSAVSVNRVEKPTYINGILIANKSYPLPSSYNPGIDSTAQSALNKMIADAKNQGVQLWIQSAFRSYQRQETIYNNYVKRDGKAKADRYSARPGHSEHQTGLAFDLNSLSQSFGETTEGKWLAANCHKYGFIIRYPKGKENVTGYMYEPWHVRYLGTDIATAVYNSGLTLEEYLGIDSVYKY